MFITKTDFSVGPQLGSQMGQYAGLYATAKKTGHEVIFFDEYKNVHRGVKIFDPFTPSCRRGSVEDFQNEVFYVYDIKNVALDEEVFQLDPKLNYDIGGCYHLYTYWDAYKADLMKEFQFKPHIVEEAKAAIAKVRSNKPLVSMHFRRTDYLQVSSLNLSMGYYVYAAEVIQNKLNSEVDILVFSDDITWCKGNVKSYDLTIHYSEGHSNYVDMCMMTMCDHNIIANSTFSWWGAYLNPNPNQIVVCPENYLINKELNFINGNWYPSHWISTKIV